MHADPLALHRLQFGLDREDEHLNVGQGVPAVAAAGTRNETSGRWRQIDGVQVAGTRHWPDMVSLSRSRALCARTAPTARTYFAYSF